MASLIPPFVFRAASNQSRGFNSPEEIDSLHGSASHYHANLSSIPEVHMMIWDHIRWKYEQPSEFSSWSFSFLYVLVHAVRKAWAEGEANTRVYVLDTSRLPASNGIHKVAELIKTYNIKFDPKDIPPSYADKSYFGHEVFIHGRLENTGNLWQAVDIDVLRAAGLWEVFPSWEGKRFKSILFQRVLELRRAYQYSGDSDFSVELDATIALARCFGDALEGVMVITIIALRKRNVMGGSVTRLLQELQSRGVQLPQLPRNVRKDLRTLRKEFSRIPEAAQLMQLLLLLHDAQTQQAAALSVVPVPATAPTGIVHAPLGQLFVNPTAQPLPAQKTVQQADLNTDSGTELEEDLDMDSETEMEDDLDTDSETESEENSS